MRLPSGRRFLEYQLLAIAHKVDTLDLYKLCLQKGETQYIWTMTEIKKGKK